MTDAARVLSYRAGGREGRPPRKDDWRTPPDLFARLHALAERLRRRP